jgi:hypothetical protein
VVAGVALRVQDDGPFAFTLDLYHENGIVRKLDTKLRLVCGLVPGSKEPASVSSEREHRVREFLLGFSVLQMPKVVRHIFTLELPSPVLEAGLVASHLRAFLSLAEHKSIPCDMLREYVRDKHSVAAFSKKVAEVADELDVPEKILMNSIG